MCVMWPEVWLWSAGFFLPCMVYLERNNGTSPSTVTFMIARVSFLFLFSRMSLSVPPAWFPPGYLPLYWTAKPTLIVFSANVFRREPVNKLLINEKRQSFTGTLFVLLHFTLCARVCARCKVKIQSRKAALEHFVMSQRVLIPRPAARCQFSPWRQMEGMSFFLNWEFLLEAVNKIRSEINPVDLKIVVLWYFSKGAQAHTGSEYKYLPFLEG